MTKAFAACIIKECREQEAPSAMQGPHNRKIFTPAIALLYLIHRGEVAERPRPDQDVGQRFRFSPGPTCWYLVSGSYQRPPERQAAH